METVTEVQGLDSVKEESDFYNGENANHTDNEMMISETLLDSGYSIKTPDSKTASTASSGSVRTERETWDRGCDFMLSLLGYAIGLGNALRFPYVCMRNGGVCGGWGQYLLYGTCEEVNTSTEGAFLVPFLICLSVVGIPLVFLEISLGQFLGRSNFRVWMMFPLFKGVGAGMMVITGIYALYFNLTMSWVLYYLVNSFRSPLPWSVCGQWWNTPSCYAQGKGMGTLSSGNTSTIDNIVNITNLANSSMASQNIYPYKVTPLTSVTSHNVTMTTVMDNVSLQRRSAVEEFWHFNVLQISSGLGDFGSMPWHLVVSLLVSWIVVYLCIMKGIKSIGKVVYVSVLMPYVLLTILLVRGLTLDGAMDGLVFYLKPDMAKVLTLQVWIEAGIQVFISLGAAWGPIITMSGYNKFSNNCLRDAIVISLVGEGTSIFCGFIVFTNLGFLAKELQVPIGEVVSSGPGLGFVAYPEALTRLPLPQLWSVIFFLALFFIGLDSQFTQVETIIAGFTDLYPRLYKRREMFTLLVCAIGFLLGLPMCLQGGMYIYQLLDWYTSILAVPLFALVESLLIGWIYGGARYCRDVELMIGRGVPAFMRICWSLVMPCVLVCFFVFSLLVYSPPQYGTYIYPAGANVFGWLLASVSVLVSVLPGLQQLASYRNMSFMERLWLSVQPTEDYKPRSKDCQKTYADVRFHYPDNSLKTRLRYNILGR